MCLWARGPGSGKAGGYVNWVLLPLINGANTAKMKIENKIKLANLTTWTMLITIAVIALWFIGFAVATTFNLNVFTNRTSEFILLFIAFAGFLVACSAVLNVSLNISLIADSKIQELRGKGTTLLNQKFYLGGLGLIGAMIAFLFLGDFLTRVHEKNELIKESNDIIARYDKSITDIANALNDTARLKEVPAILDFLSSQKYEFPDVRLITSNQFNGQLTFLAIDPNDEEKKLAKPFFGNSFYKCQKFDCEYLENYFTGKTREQFFWTEDNDYRLYYPFERSKQKFILLFNKYQRGGRLGS